MVPSHTIIHPCIDVFIIIDVQENPKTVCNRIQEKISIQRYPICLTYYDCDYILDEIERQ